MCPVLFKKPYLQSMGRKYAIRDQEALYFVTFTVVYWIDLFIRDNYREIILSSLKYCQDKKGLYVHAYCIMTSHIHLILSAQEGGNLSDILRDLKRYTSTQLRKSIEMNQQESRRKWLLWMFEKAGKGNKRNNEFQLWQQHNHPIHLCTNEMIDQRLEYIHNNPVEAGFVDDPNAWEWSSCRSYERSLADRLALTFIE